MANVVKDSELHRIVLSCVIYNDERKYLITKRASTVKVLPNKWHRPGGGMETSDYIEDIPAYAEKKWYNVLEKVLRREIREEVSVEIGKPEYLLDLTFIRPDGVPVLVLNYYAPYVSGEVDIKGEKDTVDFAWVSVDELNQYDFIKGVAEEIQMVDKILQAREQ